MAEPSIQDPPRMGEQNPSEEQEHGSHQRFRMFINWMVAAILICLGIFLLVKLQTIGQPDPIFWHKFVRDQFPVMVGLPMAGMGALFVTLVLRVAHGPIEFEGLGFKFKGGAAPIIFWFICYLGIVMSIKLLWI